VTISASLDGMEMNEARMAQWQPGCLTCAGISYENRFSHYPTR
jgi:hypothetical protein